MDTFGEYSFCVRSYECGPDGGATLPTVCNYLQEAASLNAKELGFSKSDFQADGSGISWVLTKLRVRMFRYPRWEDEVRVTTFPRGGRRIVAWRDFVVADAAGNRFGVATSEWMLIDLATRRIAAVPPRVLEAANTVREPVLGLEPFSKFRYPADAAGPAPLEFAARHSDIDLNGHVNNVHYLEWMLEPCPDVRPGELEVVFRSETFAGDRVLVATAAGAAGERYHRVYAPDGRDHVTAVTR